MKSFFNGKENGTAVILAIAVCVMLLMLALTFITSNIIEKKATANNDALIVARMAAHSALNRAIVSMKQVSNVTSLAFEDVWSHHDVNYDYAKGYLVSSADSLIYYDSLDECIRTTVDEVPLIGPLDASGTYNVASRDAKTWVYLSLPSGYGSTPIVSRIAYVVVADKGKIDASAAIDSGMNAMMLGYSRGQGLSESNQPVGGLGSDGSPGETNKEITMINPDGSYVIGRPGRDVSELFLRALGEGAGASWFKQVFDQKLSSVYSPAGTLEPGARWKDFRELCNALNIINPQGKITDIDAVNGLHSVFYLDNPPDAEAYWMNANNDDIKEESELYHRFNLMRLNWDDLTVDSILSEPVPYTSNLPDNDIYSINWIRNWKNSGDFPSADSARRQIAANLIDYCDSDTNATTDSSSSPTYFGLERCPYINEIRLMIPFTISKSASDGKYNWTVTSTGVYVRVELVDMYGVTLSGTALPRATANINMQYNMELEGVLSSNSIITSSNIDFGSIYSKNYTQTSNIISATVFGSDISPNTRANDSSSPLAIDITINSLNILLKSQGGSPESNYDFSYLITTPVTFSVFNSSTASNVIYYINFQVRDPRQNLLASDWIMQNGPSATGTLGASIPVSPAVAYGQKNSIASPVFYPTTFSGTDTDPETDNIDPWDISTAYIRNAPMLSPWELGAIHRAAKWQTINLKKYNGVEEMTGGGNAYADGDANVLDQIKMTDKKQVYGKISINSKNIDVLRVLFQKIRIGSGYTIPGWLTAYEVNAAIAENLANNLLLYNGNYNNRSQFLEESALVNLFTNYNSTGGNLQQTNDAKKEELIGKFINLTKAVKANLFTIVTIGQAVKDIGGMTVYKDLNGDGDTNDAGEQIVTQTGRFDLNADEILATQKILATIQRSSSGDTFRIQRLQYIDLDE